MDAGLLRYDVTSYRLSFIVALLSEREIMETIKSMEF